MNSFKYLPFLLLAFHAINPVSAKNSESQSGIVPATPPVNVHTSAREYKYTGWGYLNFNVALPQEIYPEFTLGNDEDAPMDIGTMEYSARGVVYVDHGHLSQNNGKESAWVLGTLGGEIESSQFTQDFETFDVTSDRSGLFVARRYTSAHRFNSGDSIITDWAFSQLISAYTFSGNTRIDSGVSGAGRYIDDFDETTYGIAYRPMVTLQPRIDLNPQWTFVPFIGATSFVALSIYDVYVNEWEDRLYGPDCFDGCEETDMSFQLIPLETFAGFDLEWKIDGSSRISLSSFFSAGISSDTESMSEIYVVYTFTN